MLQIFYGDEPYLIRSAIEQYTNVLSCPEMNYECLYGSEKLADVKSSLNMESIFDDFRVIQWTVDNMTSITEDLIELAVSSSNLLFVVLSSDVDKRKAVYKNHQEVFCLCNKEKALRNLKNSISSCFYPDALEEYLRRIDYASNPDVSYYSIVKEVEQLLSLAGGTITISHVKENIKEFVKQNTFGISNYIVNGDIENVLKQSQVADSEIALFSALFYELKVAYKSKFFALSEIGARQNPFCSLPRKNLASMINEVSNTLRDLKSLNVRKDIITRQALTSLCVLCRV